MRRRGNTQSDDWFSVDRNPGPTCLDFCRCDHCSTTCEHSIYGKCFDATGEAPLNGIRIAFPFHLDRLTYDPSVPTFDSYTNASLCLRYAFH